jgi:glycosyltransferase involved in cell wall biosynthesis
MQFMKVSAVIPTYNRSSQVCRAIDSVLAQTVRVEEIIVVDDGSTDGTADAVRDRYGCRVVLLEQENAGAAAARNRGIREARGEWIAFLDSDDVWMPTKIERQFEALAALGGEFGVCFTDCVFDGDPQMKLTAFYLAGLEDPPLLGALEEPAKFVLAGREPFWTQSLLVRHALLQAPDGFDDALVIREDTDLLFRLSFKTRFCFTSESLVRIDRNPTRVIGLCNLYSQADDRVFESLRRLYTKWLTLPMVVGSEYEPQVRQLLRGNFFNSAESKIRRLKMVQALREISRLRAMGESYASVASTLLLRKIAKFRREFDGAAQSRRRKSIGAGQGLA